MHSVKKKDQKEISQNASEFLKNFRKTKPAEEKQQVQQIQQEDNSQKVIQKISASMDFQMGSQSAMEAEELFGKLMPDTPVQSVPIKPQKSNALEKQQKILKNNPQKKDEKKSLKNNTNKTVFLINQQQKVQQTQSILRKGKITQEEKSNKSQESQEQKIEGKPNSPEKARRSVSFEGVLPLNTETQKKWKDPIQNQRKGKFDKEQQRILSQAVGKFLVTNGISLQQFQNLLTQGQKSDKFSKKQKIFAILSTALPNRSPQSCYKYLKRNFNSLNRKGKWTEQEIDRLKFLVEKYGRKWTMISKDLKRSADNCYDKFRQIGQENMNQRIKGIWKFDQTVELLKLIEKMTKIKFLDRGVEHQVLKKEIHDSKERQEIQNRKYNSKNFIFHNIAVLKPFINSRNFQKIDISQIRWNQISTYLKTRNNLDCRNKAVQLLQIFFYSAPKILDQEIIDYLITRKYQSQHQINWKEWKNKNNSSEQAKNRFMIMKKLIEGRSVKPFKTILYQLKQRVDKKTKQSNSATLNKKPQIIEEQIDQQ